METEPQVNSQPVEVEKKTSNTSLIVTMLITAVVFSLGGYYFGNKYEKVPVDISVPQQNNKVNALPSPTTIPALSNETTYTHNTFSITYPRAWQVYDSIRDKDFFITNNITGFQHFIALQNGEYYLVIGVDTQKTEGEVGGIFVSDTHFQEYLQEYDELTINGEKFFLSKSDIQLSILTNPNREIGIYALSSFSKYIPKKVTNEQKQTFNGYQDYFPMPNGSSYMIFKFSKNGNDVTSPTVQAEFIKVLQTIQW